MKRYVTISRWNGDLDRECPAVDCLAATVLESDKTPINTGLVDAHGNAIMSVQETGTFGFIKLKERT